MEKTLFDAMTKAIEEANEKELQYIIAQQEAKRLTAAYKAYMQGGSN